MRRLDSPLLLLAALLSGTAEEVDVDADGMLEEGTDAIADTERTGGSGWLRGHWGDWGGEAVWRRLRAAAAAGDGKGEGT